MELCDKEVGRIALGTAPFAFGSVTTSESIEVISAALAHGCRMIDTAIAYTRAGVPSYAEDLVRAALESVPAGERPLVATKGGQRRVGADFPIEGTLSGLRRDCETSLEHLGVDRIDLYQLHHVDPRTPLEDSVAALGRLQQEGLIAHIGLSNVSIAQIETARSIVPIASVQNLLSVLDMSDLPVAEHCAAIDVAYLAYQPLTAGGGSVRTIDVLNEIGAGRGVSAEQVALAWLSASAASVLPLVGSTRVSTITDSLAAAELRLTDEESRRVAAWVADREPVAADT